MSFNADLEFGRIYEQEFLNYIDYDECVQAPNACFPDWDWKIRRGNVWTKYEIKCDRMAHRTGNLFIEFACSGKPSGIQTTKSDYYFIFIVDGKKIVDVYEIQTSYLKELCASRKYGTRICYNEGRNQSEGYIIPILDIM